MTRNIQFIIPNNDDNLSLQIWHIGGLSDKYML